MEAILLGADSKFNVSRKFKKFRKTEYCETLIDSLDFFLSQYRENLNLDYKNKIDSLYFIDQNIIRNNKSVRGNYAIDKTTLPENKFELDSLIFADVLNLIEKYGFTTEQNVGEETFRKVLILYHHNVRLPENEKHIELMQKALKEGAYFPKDYAWMYDQGKMFKKESPYFHYGVPSNKKVVETDKEIINKRRKEWGIKPLDAQKTIVRRRSFTIKQLW